MLILSVAGVAVALALLAREVFRLRRRSIADPLPDDQLATIAEFEGQILAEAFAERLKSLGIFAVFRNAHGDYHRYGPGLPWAQRWQVAVFARDVERATELLPDDQR